MSKIHVLKKPKLVSCCSSAQEHKIALINSFFIVNFVTEAPTV